MKTTIAILFFLLCLATCKGQTKWVSSNFGNDNNTGVKEAPYQTIGKAIPILFTLDTLNILEGSYSEYIDRLSFGIGDKQIIVMAPPQKVLITLKGKTLLFKDDENIFSIELSDYSMSRTIPEDYKGTVYYNTAVTTYINKNDCPIGYSGSREYYTVVAKLYASLISQADAQNKAKEDALRSKQLWANHVGVCTKQ